MSKGILVHKGVWILWGKEGANTPHHKKAKTFPISEVVQALLNKLSQNFWIRDGATKPGPNQQRWICLKLASQ